MLLFWRIRYLDKRNKQFENRDLWLETNKLDPPTRASIELCNDLRSVGHERSMLQYRGYFKEWDISKSQINALAELHGGMDTIFLPRYFEDEFGNELTETDIARTWTDSQTVVAFPSETPKHTIDYALSERRPISVEDVTLSENQLSVFAYFVRDLRELIGSSFNREGPGKLTKRGDQDPMLRTATTDDEIRSFITIFRRLYMVNERANFLKATSLFIDIAKGNSLRQWIHNSLVAYESSLEKPPSWIPFCGELDSPFTRKRLIDVFLNTKYAHQPKENRERQYRECLSSVGNKQALLTWLFLGALHECCLHMQLVGIEVANYYDRYCKHHKINHKILNSVAIDHPEIGVLEKKQAHIDRLIDERSRELALSLWIQNGKPVGGSEQYFSEAREQLKATLE